MPEIIKSGRVTAGSDGIATTQLGPERAGESWVVKRMSVTSTSVTLVPTCKVYRGRVVPSAIIDGTYTGTFDINDLSSPIQLLPGDILTAQWTGSDVGSTCVFTLEGTSSR